jgi:hypothetical protein
MSVSRENISPISVSLYPATSYRFNQWNCGFSAIGHTTSDTMPCIGYGLQSIRNSSDWFLSNAGITWRCTKSLVDGRWSLVKGWRMWALGRRWRQTMSADYADSNPHAKARRTIGKRQEAWGTRQEKRKSFDGLTGLTRLRIATEKHRGTQRKILSTKF